jgi:hypothetical protein
MKTRIYLALVVIFVTLVPVGPAAAQKELPFHGTIQGVETGVVTTFPILSVDGSGTGIATHLGRFTMTWVATVNILSGSGSGSFHFIAANGDSIFTEGTGQADLTAPAGPLPIEETLTITGGTGRFEGATGGFTLNRLLESGFTSGSFDGTIVMDKAK